MSLKINFYCDEIYQGCLPEPIEASKCFPEWFSSLPLENEKKYVFENDDIYHLKMHGAQNNVKKCPGISDFLKVGYIIPSWADFIFREENGDLYVNWIENYFDEIEYFSHTTDQYFTMPNKPIYNHFGKVFTPWIIKTDPGVSCLITHPVWHNNKSFTSSTGVFHTDAVPLRLPWFFEWNYKVKTGMNVENIDIENQVIPKGEPIVLVIPFYRKKFKHNINYVSETTITNLIKQQESATHKTIRGKCPYTEFKKTLGKLF